MKIVICPIDDMDIPFGIRSWITQSQVHIRQDIHTCLKWQHQTREWFYFCGK